MNTVVLYIDESHILGQTFECGNEDEQRLAVNLICQAENIEELSDDKFNEFIDNEELYLGFGNGTIYVGVLESVS